MCGITAGRAEHPSPRGAANSRAGAAAQLLTTEHSTFPTCTSLPQGCEVLPGQPWALTPPVLPLQLTHICLCELSTPAEGSGCAAPLNTRINAQLCVHFSCEPQSTGELAGVTWQFKSNTETVCSISKLTCGHLLPKGSWVSLKTQFSPTAPLSSPHVQDVERLRLGLERLIKDGKVKSCLQ